MPTSLFSLENIVKAARGHGREGTESQFKSSPLISLFDRRPCYDLDNVASPKSTPADDITGLRRFYSLSHTHKKEEYHQTPFSLNSILHVSFFLTYVTSFIWQVNMTPRWSVEARMFSLTVQTYLYIWRCSNLLTRPQLFFQPILSVKGAILKIEQTSFSAELPKHFIFRNGGTNMYVSLLCIPNSWHLESLSIYWLFVNTFFFVTWSLARLLFFREMMFHCTDGYTTHQQRFQSWRSIEAQAIKQSKCIYI
jgi:hypothetical protein